MLPADLQPRNFDSYPLKAREVALRNLDLLRTLPLAFAPFLLKELVAFDWQFPAEQTEVTRQLAYLTNLSGAQREKQLQVFARLRLTDQIAALDWVNAPGRFLEQLSAYLWASHQMDAFRSASEDYMRGFRASVTPVTPSIPRVGIVLIGQGVTENRYSLFRKLRRHGTYFDHVSPENGLTAILQFAHARADAHPLPFGHWYIDGDEGEDAPRLTCVSFGKLNAARGVLTRKMKQSYESPAFGAEALRTMLAETKPEDLGMRGDGASGTLNRFQVSLLTEGSGTQVYSTSFVQWAAREAYRRAQAVTLVARFTPRLREQPMNELLEGAQHAGVRDPAGSLIDADMGAYYTWLNQQRLPGAAQASFLVWLEARHEAIVLGPGFQKESQSAENIDMLGLLSRMGSS